MRGVLRGARSGLAVELAMLAATWIGAGAAEARIVVVPEAHFKIEIPTNWQVPRNEIDKDGKTWVVHVASEKRNLRLRIRATPRRGAVNLKSELASWEKNAFRHNLQRFAKYDVREAQVHGRKAILAFYRAEMIVRTKVKPYRVIAMMTYEPKGWLFSLTGFVKEEVYQEKEEVLGQVVSSFDVLGSLTPTCGSSAAPRANPRTPTT